MDSYGKIEPKVTLHEIKAGHTITGTVRQFHIHCIHKDYITSSLPSYVNFIGKIYSERLVICQ